MSRNLTFISLFFCLFLFGQKEVKITRIERDKVVEGLFDEKLKPFYHGVASGDPTHDAVIL